MSLQRHVLQDVEEVFPLVAERQRPLVAVRPDGAEGAAVDALPLKHQLFVFFCVFICNQINKNAVLLDLCFCSVTEGFWGGIPPRNEIKRQNNVKMRVNLTGYQEVFSDIRYKPKGKLSTENSNKGNKVWLKF